MRVFFFLISSLAACTDKSDDTGGDDRTTGSTSTVTSTATTSVTSTPTTSTTSTPTSTTSTSTVDTDPDADGDGVLASEDCDDTDAEIFPGAEERCNGLDDDCDEEIDEDIVGPLYLDADSDGWGDEERSVAGCEVPEYATLTPGDCDDLDAEVSPDAAEVCNGIDDDCDGDTDEDDATDAAIWYADSDGDGYGDSAVTTVSCESSSSTVEDDTDCDDSDPEVFPGSARSDDPATSTDGDCDGTIACIDANCDGNVDMLHSGYWGAVSGYTEDDVVYWGDGGDMSSATTTTLDEGGTWWHAADDLDGDGYVDLVVVSSSGTAFPGDAGVVYWGSAAGYSTADATALEAPGSNRVAIADFDADGWPDLVFATFRVGNNAATGYVGDSYVYWGSKAGYSDKDRTALPTTGAWDIATGDFDVDGNLDLVFCSYYDDESGDYYEPPSLVYWGDGSDFSTGNVTELATAGCRDVKTADLDADGYPELVIANTFDNSGDWKIDSTIYWGGPSGYSEAASTGLPTSYTWGAVIGDFNGDGWDDVAFSSGWNEDGYDGPSYVYYSDAGTFDPLDVDELDGDATYSLGAADLNNDGIDDLVLPGMGNDVLGATTTSRVYWGHSDGLSQCVSTELTTPYPGEVSIGDMNADGWPELVFPAPYGWAGYESSPEALIFWGSEDGYSDDEITAFGDGRGAWVAPLLIGDTDW